MLRRLLAATLFVGSTLTSAVSLAETELSFYSGYQSSPHSGVSGDDPEGVGEFDFTAGWEGRPFESPFYYGFRLTWWTSEKQGWGIDFNHTKAYADDDTLGPDGKSEGFEVLEFTDGLNNLTFNYNYRWKKPDRRFVPYVGVGLGVIIPHVEVQTTNSSPKTFEYQVAGPTMALNAGYAIDLSEHWRYFVEYKFTYSQLDADLDGGGNLETDIITNALNVGISYIF